MDKSAGARWWAWTLGGLCTLMPDQCPLCRQDKIVMPGSHPNRDMRAFRCSCCGDYFIDPLAATEVLGWPQADAYLICAAVRAASDAGRRLEITQADLPILRDSAPRWQSVFEGVDRLLLLLGSRRTSILGAYRFRKEVDFPLIVARGEREMNELLVLAGNLGFLDIHQNTFTIDGLRRVDELQNRLPNSRQAFVAMWFDKTLDVAWTDGFKPGIEESAYFSAVRVDSIEHSGRIVDRIVAEIKRSGLLVADFTGDRGGVYFEAGLAQGWSIPVIWTCRDDYKDKLHFDTRQYNHIIWNSPEELRERLSQRIRANHLPRAQGH